MAKTPRLDPYLRLLSRLYEALYLLDILGRVRGPHHVTNLGNSTPLASRRRFLNTLAFLCDYTKGGPSTSSVALQTRSDCNVFWISSNEGPPDSVVEFLRAVIETVKSLHTIPEGDRAAEEEELLRRCVQFCAMRIRKQAHGLANSVGKCQAFLAERESTDNTALASWLGQFAYSSYRDLPAICQGAYRARRDPEMATLAERVREPGAGMAFQKARHAIGRLAAYVRAVKDLLVDSRHLGDLMDVSEVDAVPLPSCVPRARADDHTTLGGVLRRIVKSSDSRYPKLLGYLSNLNGQTGLEDELLAYYAPNRHAPRVHAEIQMLHHFYENRLAFFAGDEYIAISKPACLGCKLYFRHHPAGYEEPDSHEKVCPNWSPILLLYGAQDPGWSEHRKVLTTVVNDLGKEVLKEIERRRSFQLQHQDTLTGLTVSSLELGDESTDSGDSDWTGGSRRSGSGFDTDSEGGVAI